MPKILPPLHPRIIGAQRFFFRQRPGGFDIECPRCGLVYRITRKSAASVFDPRTARFRCSHHDGCSLILVLGCLAWPVAASVGGKTPPYDQVPGPRQLAQLRAEGAGWWMPDEYAIKGRPQVTNLTGVDERIEPEAEDDLQLADGEEDQ
jgi:hypothetical protein